MRTCLIIVIVVLILGLLGGCALIAFGAAALPNLAPALMPTVIAAISTPAATATSGSIAPTATRPATAPTATKAAPAVAPTAAAPADFGGLWSSAQTKAKSASKYRMGLSWLVGTTDNGVFKELPFMVTEGYSVGADMYQAFSAGMLNDLMGGTKVEMMNVAGKTYIRGATVFGMMDPTKWYVMPSGSQNNPPVEPGDMFSMANPSSNTGANAPKKTGSETLDGQSCDIWTWPLPSSSDFLSVLQSPDQQADFSTIDRSESRAWLCSDGYVHKVAMDIAGHNQTNVNEKGTMKMEARMWDFDNPALVITAPDGALPFAP